GCARRAARRLVHTGADLLDRQTQFLRRALDLVHIVGVHRFPHRLDLALDGLARVCRNLLTVVAQGLLGGEHEAVRPVADLHLLAATGVLRSVALRLADHALDLGIAQAAAGRDRDLLLAPGRLVL